MLKRVVLGILSITIFSSNTIYSSTLENIVLEALLSHPFFKLQSLDQESQVLKRKKIFAQLDTKFRLNTTISQSSPVSNSSFSPNKIDSFSLVPELTKQIKETGGTVSLSYNLNRTKQSYSNTNPAFSAFLVSSPFYTQQLTLNYSQPLFRNFLNKSFHLNLVNHDIQTKLNDITLATQSKVFLLNLAQIYTRWLSNYEKQKIIQKRLNLNEKLKKDTYKKYQRNLVKRIDYLQVKNQNLQLQQQLRQINNSVDLIKNNLIELLDGSDVVIDIPSLPKIINFHNQALLPKESILKNDLNLAFLAVQKHAIQVAIEQVNESQKSNLILNTYVGLVDGDESFGNSSKFSKSNIGASLVYQHNLDNTGLKAEEALLKTNLAKLDEQIRDYKINFNIAYRDITNSVSTYEDILRINKRQIKTNEQAVAEQEKLYNRGIGDISTVIRAYDQLLNSKIQLESTTELYYLKLLDYFNLTNKFLEFN